MSELVNGLASGPVLQSVLLVVLAHSELGLTRQSSPREVVPSGPVVSNEYCLNLLYTIVTMDVLNITSKESLPASILYQFLLLDTVNLLLVVAPNEIFTRHLLPLKMVSFT